MDTKRNSVSSGQTDASAAPLPVDLRSAVYWLRQTYRTEMVHRRGHTRKWSAVRIARLVRPNLKRPVFAIGAPRSGTTFLGDCLAVLPDISYHFEPVVTKAAVRYVYERLWPTWRARRLYRTTYAWLMRLSAETDLRFCEKTPGNCFIQPFLKETFPDAKFIHIVRDGRDAALSLSRKPWYRNDVRDSGLRDPDGYLFGPSSRFWVEPGRIAQYENTSDLRRCIWLWRRYVEEALAGARDLPAADYYQVRYEDLLAAPGRYADEITAFLDIPGREARSAFRDHLVRDAHADSVGGWRTGIDAAMQRELHEEAGALLTSLGYEVPVEM